MAERVLKNKRTTSKSGRTRTVKVVQDGKVKTKKATVTTPKGKRKTREVTTLKRDNKSNVRVVEKSKGKPKGKFKQVTKSPAGSFKRKELSTNLRTAGKKKNTLTKTKTRNTNKGVGAGKSTRKTVYKGRVGNENAGNQKYRAKLKRRK